MDNEAGKDGRTGSVPWWYIEDAARPQATKLGAKSISALMLTF